MEGMRRRGEGRREMGQGSLGRVPKRERETVRKTKREVRKIMKREERVMRKNRDSEGGKKEM